LKKIKKQSFQRLVWKKIFTCNKRNAIRKLNELQPDYAYDFEGKRFDVGEKLGFIKITLEIALQRDELKEELLEYLSDLMIGEISEESPYYEV